MEDLKHTALAYYVAAKKEIKDVVDNFYREMKPNDAGGVKFKKFAKYMETIGCKHMSSVEFFNELKQAGKNVLLFDDIITLFYIIHSGRPFCGGSCKKFVKGMYFTCVKCYEDTSHSGASTFSVCAHCFSNERNYKHEHKEFLDPIALLHVKRMEALYKHSKSSSTVDPQRTTTSTDSRGKRELAKAIIVKSPNDTKKTKYERSTSSTTTVVMKPSSHDKPDKIATNSSLSTAIVPAVNQKSKQAKLQTAIQLGQLVASIGSIFASQLCTIM